MAAPTPLVPPVPKTRGPTRSRWKFMGRSPATYQAVQSLVTIGSPDSAGRCNQLACHPTSIRGRARPRSAHLGEAVADFLGVQRRLLPGGEVATPVQDVVMDQVRHPPIDPAPRGAEGLARLDADAYGNLQLGRRGADGEAFPI